MGAGDEEIILIHAIMHYNEHCFSAFVSQFFLPLCSLETFFSFLSSSFMSSQSSTYTNLSSFPSSLHLYWPSCISSYMVSILKTEAGDNAGDNRAGQGTIVPLDVADDTFNPANSCNYSNYL